VAAAVVAAAAMAAAVVIDPGHDRDRRDNSEQTNQS
jgi:hypothetical protein